MGSLVLTGATTGSATLTPTDAQTVTLTLPATSGTLSVSGGSPSFATLTVTGDASISGLTVGKGGGAYITNTVLGISAGQAVNTTGQLVAIGYQAAYSNTSGADNVAVGGYQTLYTNTSGSQNIAIGRSALFTNLSGGSNVAIGNQASYSNSTGANNVAIGLSALYANTASNNTAIGHQSLYSNTTASNNTAVGYQAGYSQVTGAGNVYVGQGAGQVNTGGANTFIGTASGNAMTTGNFNTVLGSYSGNQGGLDIRTSSNYIVLSDGAGNPRGYFDNAGSLFVGSGIVCFTTSQYRSNIASSQLQFINNSAGVSLAVNGTSWGSLSDERDKDIIEPITDAISKIGTLRTVIGKYKVDEEGTRRSFLIAQDVKNVLPEAVTELEDDKNTLILQYTETIPLLVAAIKELNTKLDAQAAQIAALTGVK
jgi:hypothetical protein